MTQPPPENEGHRRIEQLRQWRNRQVPDLTLSGLVDQVEKRFGKPQKQLGRLAAAWEAIVPEPLCSHTALAGFGRGVLTVHAADSASRFQLDRFLRSGGERQIRQALGGQLRKIQIKVVPL